MRREDGKSTGSFVVTAEDDRMGNRAFNFIPMRRLNARWRGWLIHASEDRG